MKEIRVVASAVAFTHGKLICPICGAEKSAKAKTCRDCFLQYGKKATEAAVAIQSAVAAVNEGHRAASNGDVVRETVFGPVLVKFAFNKKGMLRQPGNGISSYMEFNKSVIGGAVNVFAFGFAHQDMGQEHTCLVEVREKLTKADEVVHYLRLQKVAEKMYSNFRVTVGEFESTKHAAHMPKLQVLDYLHRGTNQERLLSYSVGCEPAQID